MVTAAPTASAPGYVRLRRAVLAVAVVGGPLAYLVGGLLAPAIHDDAEQTIAANAAADPTTNMAHLVAFVLASFLLPLGAFALAELAFPREPWLATIGGLLGVAGWLPFAALTALDDVTATMADLPERRLYAELLDRFTTDPVMTIYLVVYVVLHLVAYVLLGIALGRARVIPWWAAWCLIASSPVTVLAFALPGSPRLIGGFALGLLVLGSLPAARRALSPAS